MTKQRSMFSVYAIELSVGVAAGLTLLLVVLGVLQFAFPSSTGLGELVSPRQNLQTGARPAGRAGGAQSVVAVLSEVRRDVRERPSSSIVWSAATRGMPLEDGHAVQSYEASSAMIAFDEHNKIELGEKSVIVLRSGPRRDDRSRRRTTVLFMSGLLRGRLGGGAAHDADVEVVAGGGAVRPREGARKSVDIALVSDEKTSALSVLGGSAEIVWKDKTTVVPPGFMVKFDEEHPPENPAPLPASPELLAPRDGASFRGRGAPPVVSFSWRSPDDTPEFAVELARDPKFARIAYKGRHKQTTFTHGALSEGEYYWRVIGMRDSLPGEPSSVGRFTIVRDQEAPQLKVEFPGGPVSGRTFVLRGATAPGCRVMIGEVDIPTDAAGRFEYTVALEEGYNFLVVQAINPAGNTAFASRTVVARLADSKRAR